MKDVMNYRDGTYERYLAFNYATKIKSLYNIAINGKMTTDEIIQAYAQI